MLSRSVRVDVPEGDVAHGLAELQAAHPDVQIGSYPFFENKRLGTYVVLRAIDVEKLAAAENALWIFIRQRGLCGLCCRRSLKNFRKTRITRAGPRARAGLTPALARGIPRGLVDRNLRRSAKRTQQRSHRRAADRETRTTPCAPLAESRSSDAMPSARGEPWLRRGARADARKRFGRGRPRSLRASVTDCFGREIKKARGRCPAPLENYLFLAVLRRAVPVFFAVVFFAAAVLRAGFFFAGFFFATAIVHPSFGLAGC